jgi:hypothetical protein
MTIVNANSIKAKEVLADMISKVGSTQTDEAINMWLTFGLGTEMFNAWITFDEDEPIGMITAEVVDADGPAVYIAFNWFKSGQAGNENLITKVGEWARELEIKKILYYTKKSPNTFIKKYGFSLVQSVLQKDV